MPSGMVRQPKRRMKVIRNELTIDPKVSDRKIHGPRQPIGSKLQDNGQNRCPNGQNSVGTSCRGKMLGDKLIISEMEFSEMGFSEVESNAGERRRSFLNRVKRCGDQRSPKFPRLCGQITLLPGLPRLPKGSMFLLHHELDGG